MLFIIDTRKTCIKISNNKGFDQTWISWHPQGRFGWHSFLWLLSDRSFALRCCCWLILLLERWGTLTQCNTVNEGDHRLWMTLTKKDGRERQFEITSNGRNIRSRRYFSYYQQLISVKMTSWNGNISALLVNFHYENLSNNSLLYKHSLKIHGIFCRNPLCIITNPLK